MKTWYEIKAKNQAAIIRIFDEIGEYGTTAQDFINQLGAVGDVQTITLQLNSPGGSVQDGIAIFNALKRHPAKIIVEIDGWALSIASLIAMAGDRVFMAENALMMLHNPWSGVTGNSEELRKGADLLDKVRDTMLSAYCGKSGMDKDRVAGLMNEETWFTAEEALAAGLIDEIYLSLAMAASFDPTRFTIPERLKGYLAMPAHIEKPEQSTAEIHAAAVRAEADRRNEIRAAFAPAIAKFSESAPGLAAVQAACEADPDCSVAQAKLKILDELGRDSSPVAGHYFVGVSDNNRVSDFKAAATDAILIRSGVRVSDPSPQSRDLMRSSIVSIAESILSMRGKSTRDLGRGEIIKAALTTSDFPSLLADTAGKSLRTGYENEPATHVIWTGEKDVPDFKTQSMVALSEAPGLLEVQEGGEYKNGVFGEAAESFSIKTYGRVLEITRQALVNDDLSALTTLPSAFGASARRMEADLVYGRLTGSQVMADGLALFHADHGNLAASGSTLGILGLSAARAGMRKQKGVNGLGFIDPQPRFLIVPVALETSAEQLINSITVPSVAANASVEWMKNLVVVADPRLDAVSETAWYLAASPTQIDGIVRAYLAGQPRPFYEEDEEFRRDVLGVKCRLDFGVGVIDFRALYKDPGAA